MTRSRPRLSIGTKLANRNSLLRPQAHCRSASEASLTPHPSLALHSPFTQKPRKWLTWTNAPLVRSARGAGGARSESGNPRISGEPGRRSGPPPVECAQAGFRKAVERLPAYRRPPLAIAAPLPLRPRFASPSAPGVPFFPFLFARLALTLGRAKAIPPRPKRRTKLRPAF